MFKSVLQSLTLLFGSSVLLAGQNRDLRIEPIDPAARRSFEKQVKVALVVGISVYPQGSGLSSLKYAARDADVLGDALKSQGYLVRKLVDSDATRAVIRRALRELSDVVSPDERQIGVHGGDAHNLFDPRQKCRGRFDQELYHARQGPPALPASLPIDTLRPIL